MFIDYKLNEIFGKSKVKLDLLKLKINFFKMLNRPFLNDTKTIKFLNLHLNFWF